MQKGNSNSGRPVRPGAGRPLWPGHKQRSPGHWAGPYGRAGSREAPASWPVRPGEPRPGARATAGRRRRWVNGGEEGKQGCGRRAKRKRASPGTLRCGRRRRGAAGSPGIRPVGTRPWREVGDDLVDPGPPRPDSAVGKGEEDAAMLPIVFDLRGEDRNASNELGNPAVMEELVRGKKEETRGR